MVLGVLVHACAAGLSRLGKKPPALVAPAKLTFRRHIMKFVMYDVANLLQPYILDDRAMINGIVGSHYSRRMRLK
jgi:hypothetical protein